MSSQANAKISHGGMDSVFSRALKIVQDTRALAIGDPSYAIVHALNSAGLLANPEDGAGAGQTRRPLGDGPREHEERQEQPQPSQVQRTDLEEQALAWDESCQRAQRVAEVIKRHIGQHPAFQSLQIKGDRLLVCLHILNQSQWGEWRRYFGIQHDKETTLPYVTAGDGHRDGVQVGVLAYDLPESRSRAQRTAKAPYELDGIVYDLALPQRDASGLVWFYEGARTADGMPLLSAADRPELCTLPNLVQQAGPLTPVTDNPSPQAKSVMTPVEAGGQA
ncbi:BN159_2729 family protein [Streptomyces sp. NPDC055210]